MWDDVSCETNALDKVFWRNLDFCREIGNDFLPVCFLRVPSGSLDILIPVCHAIKVKVKIPDVKKSMSKYRKAKYHRVEIQFQSLSNDHLI